MPTRLLGAVRIDAGDDRPRRAGGDRWPRQPRTAARGSSAAGGHGRQRRGVDHRNGVRRQPRAPPATRRPRRTVPRPARQESDLSQPPAHRRPGGARHRRHAHGQRDDQPRSGVPHRPPDRVCGDADLRAPDRSRSGDRAGALRPGVCRRGARSHAPRGSGAGRATQPVRPPGRGRRRGDHRHRGGQGYRARSLGTAPLPARRRPVPRPGGAARPHRGAQRGAAGVRHLDRSGAAARDRGAARGPHRTERADRLRRADGAVPQPEQQGDHGVLADAQRHRGGASDSCHAHGVHGAGPEHRRPRGSDGRCNRLRARLLRLPPRTDGAGGHRSAHLRRRDGGAGGPDRVRQDHPHPVGEPHLRPRRRAHRHRRRRPARLEPDQPALADRHHQAGRVPVLAVGGRQHRLRPPRRRPARPGGGRTRGRRPRFHRSVQRRLRHHHRRARRDPVGRPAAAYRPGARVSERPAHSHSGRLHQRHRQRHRGPDTARAVQRAARAHHADHHPPAVARSAGRTA